MRTLEDTSRELFAILEQSNRPNDTIFRQYFDDLAMRVGMSEELIGMKNLAGLENMAREEFIPAYREFCEKRSQILERGSKRNLLKYIGWTIVGLNVAEAILTRGRSLRPPIILTTLLLETGLGAAAYWCAGKVDLLRVQTQERNLFKDMRALDAQQKTRRRYGVMQGVLGGEDTAGIYGLLSNYEDPAAFWSEYESVRQADPSSEKEVNRLKQPFRDFVAAHPYYSQAQREERFAALFGAAHAHFARQDPEYVTKVLEGT